MFKPTARIASVFAATIMDVVYAIKVAERDDPYITLTERLASIFNDLAVPGRYLVEVFPFLRFLPSWFPGAAFKKTARTWRPHVTAAIDVPYAAALENMVRSLCRMIRHPPRLILDGW